MVSVRGFWLVLLIPPWTAHGAIVDVRAVLPSGAEQVASDPVSARVQLQSPVSVEQPVPDRAAASADASSGVARAEAFAIGGDGSGQGRAAIDGLFVISGPPGPPLPGRVTFQIDAFSDPLAGTVPTGQPLGGETVTNLRTRLRVLNVIGPPATTDLRFGSTWDARLVTQRFFAADSTPTVSFDYRPQAIDGGSGTFPDRVGAPLVTFTRTPSSIGFAGRIAFPIDVQAGLVYQLRYEIEGSAAGAPAHGAFADLGNSAHVRVELPEGFSYAGLDGFLDDPAPLPTGTAVPVPVSTTLLLGFLAAALAVLGAVRRAAAVLTRR